MKIYEIQQYYYHGSDDNLPVGTILKPQSGYEDRWGQTEFYQALERHRPSNMLGHANSVFMTDNPDDIDAAGGGTEWLFTVKPSQPVQRHDLNWSSEISSLVDRGFSLDSYEVTEAAKNYWAGVPHPNESVWEYLAPSAEIIAVEEY